MLLVHPFCQHVSPESLVLARYTPDGNILLSPVGNRVNAVDLVQGRLGRWDPGSWNCWGVRGDGLDPTLWVK